MSPPAAQQQRGNISWGGKLTVLADHALGDDAEAEHPEDGTRGDGVLLRGRQLARANEPVGGGLHLWRLACEEEKWPGAKGERPRGDQRNNFTAFTPRKRRSAKFSVGVNPPAGFPPHGP